ncbi:retrovirus-related pol polyprotein from transposon TNT 1-94 [Tanacetum coccineum]
MIKGWLTTAMEKEIRGSVKYATSASEIWKDLQEWFRKESASRAYELKQASRNWYQKFMSALLQLNYKQSAADHSLFIYNKGKVFVTALIYVDDVIMTGNDEDQIKEIKKLSWAAKILSWNRSCKNQRRDSDKSTKIYS